MIDPDDEAIASHVEVVIVEVFEDAFFDGVSLSQMEYDESCCVVGNKAHDDADPDASEPARGESN